MRYFFALCALLMPADFAAGAETVALADARRTAVVRAVEQVQPSVVSIHVTYRERVMQRYRLRDPLWDLFSPFYYVVPSERDRTSTGSGLIVSTDGYVLTNSHVVGDPERLQKITVSLPDGRDLKAGHLASDVSSDLAVLKVEADNLPVAPLGYSSDILVGEWAIAIGNPFDLGPTVSIGVISALDRDFSEPQGEYYYRDMIQTDAAINPGNSGGPLVNALGQVVGINSFIYTGGDFSIGSIGIGFAIPIDAARSFLEEVRQHGQVRRAWHGIRYLQDLTRPLAEYLSLPSMEGALVVKVEIDSPAYRAELKRGDVIIAINEEKVRKVDDAIAILKGFRVDEECILTIIRYGETLSLRMRLEEFPHQRRWY